MFSMKTNSLNEHQIDADLKRTLLGINVVNKEECILKLKNVLVCYSIRNSSIGYCQGFNVIAATLLEVLDEEVK